MKLEIEFDNARAIQHFKDWLCSRGEQDYWEWMGYREQEEQGDITVLDFDYRVGPYKIKAYCGRRDA